MPSLFFTCPNTRQQADTGIMTDAESLRDTWSMTLNVNCPHCGQMHAVSVRETYIDDAIRNVVGDRAAGVRSAFGAPPRYRQEAGEVTTKWSAPIMRRRGVCPTRPADAD